MKKFFAILVLAVSATLLTACSEKGETVVEDISATESIAVEATDVTTEEVTTSEEITTAETTVQTEESTTETTAEMRAKNASFPTGEWLNCVIKFDYADEKVYTFNDDGTFKISMEIHDAFGKYTFSDNVLTMTFDLSEQGWGIHNFSFDVAKVNNIYVLKYKSEEIDGSLPDMHSVTQTSAQELIVELENLFWDYRNEEMLCFEKY